MEQFKQFFERLKGLGQANRSLFNISYDVARRLLILFLVGLSFLMFIGLGMGMGYFASVIAKTEVPTQSQLQASLGQLNQTSALYYANGELVSEVQTDLVREIVSFEDISEYVKQGIIATEDSYFYEHDGIVPKAIIRATLQELLGSATQSGGSTLTQQLVKQQLLTNEYTFTRKVKEIALAMHVEKYFSKEAILSAYLNVSPFGRNSSGQNIAGIQAAANGIFGVSAKDLTLAQAAYLVGLPQSPYSYTPYTNRGTLKEDTSLGIKRMHLVLDAMKKENYITQEEWQAAKEYDITKDFIPAKEIVKPTQSYLYQAIFRETVLILMKQAIERDGRTLESVSESVDLYNSYYALASAQLSSNGYNVYSTIDKGIYDTMQQTVATNASKLGTTYQTTYTNEQGETKTVSEPPQVGSVLIENKSGKILGFVGGVDFNISQIDHALMTRRSPGSTIKPLLVYAPAIEEKVIYPATMLADTAIKRVQPDGSYWEPTNANGTVSNQFLSARQALVRSLNNPTIHLYGALLAKGTNPGTYMQKMGITDIPLSEYANEAASVGGFSFGPTVREQTSAFTTFANNGQYIPSYLIEKIEDKQGNIIYQHEQTNTRVFSEDTAYLTRDILKAVLNDSYGTAYALRQTLTNNIPELIIKTGTSDNYQDLWVIASTPQVTLGQWAGWDNNYGQRHVFPASAGFEPQRLWGLVFNDLQKQHAKYFDRTIKFSDRPTTITQQSVLSATGTKEGLVTLPDGSSTTITGEYISDLFSASNPPSQAAYYFSPGASKEDIQRFWQGNLDFDKKKEDEESQEDEDNSSSQRRRQTSQTSEDTREEDEE